MTPLYLFDSTKADKWECTQNTSGLYTKIDSNGLYVYGHNEKSHVVGAVQFMYMDNGGINLEPGYTKLYTELSAAYAIENHADETRVFCLRPAYLNSEYPSSYNSDVSIPFIKRNTHRPEIHDNGVNFINNKFTCEYKKLEGAVFPAITISFGTTTFKSFICAITKIWLE